MAGHGTTTVLPDESAVWAARSSFRAFLLLPGFALRMFTYILLGITAFSAHQRPAIRSPS